MTTRPTYPIRILIADDHAVVRQGLRTFLELHDDVDVVGEADTGAAAVQQARDLSPDVVLMDLVMPEMSGLDAIRQIRTDVPEAQVLVLTSYTEDEKVFPAIRAGAAGYLLKDVSPAELIDAVRATHKGDAQLHPEIAKRLMQEVASPTPGQRSHETLTERELDVLGLIARGLSNREIGTTLHISETTVKTHVSNILGKLHLDDRTQAAVYAVTEGLVSEEDL